MKPLATHLFELDPVGHAAHRGETPCRFCPCRHCPLVFGNQAHQLPERSAEEQALEARILGEGADDDL